jgi:hypothetical protein
MKGFGLIFCPDAGSGPGELHTFDAPVDLEFLQNAVGGYIELVPGFDRIGGRACVAFCNEHGKLHLELPFNRRATQLWEEALGRSLRSPRGVWRDFLVGPVLVLYGDDEFMAEL